MKKIISIALAALLVLTLGITAMAATSTAQAYISVSAKAEVEVDPDVCYIRLGVTSKDASATKATEDNAKKMKSVIDAVKALGLTDADIATSNISMYPTYDYTKGESTITGYQVSNTVTLTVRNLDLVSKLVNTGLNSGANNLDNVRFDLEEQDPYYLEALSKATKKLLPKAQAMASASGLSLGSLLSLSESGTSYSPIYANVNYEAGEDMQMDEAVMADGAYPSPMEAPAAGKTNIGDTIVAGKITVTASVTGAYAIK